MKAPRTRLDFEACPLLLKQMTRLAKRVERAIEDLGLAEVSGDCELTNEGRTIILKNPTGDIVHTFTI